MLLFLCEGVGARTTTGTRTIRTRRQMGLQTENLYTPYVINQFLYKGWIWAFQLKSYLMVLESVASDEVLLFFLK